MTRATAMPMAIWRARTLRRKLKTSLVRVVDVGEVVEEPELVEPLCCHWVLLGALLEQGDDQPPAPVMHAEPALGRVDLVPGLLRYLGVALVAGGFRVVAIGFGLVPEQIGSAGAAQKGHEHWGQQG